MSRTTQLRIAAIAVGVAIFWAIGGFDADESRAPEQARVKASLCGVAEESHAAYLDGAREMGLVREAGTRADRTFELVVDWTMWNEWSVEQQELLAIAGWCQVAGDDGRGIAVVVSADDNQQVASVVDGEFVLDEGPRD